MSLAGFMTVGALKTRILPASRVGDVDYDAALQSLGNGVAGRMNRHCNRVFERAVGATYTTHARSSSFCLDRAPIESISEVLWTPFGSSSGTDIVDDIQNQFNDAGLVEFARVIGDHRDTLRFTFTGGYWIDDEGSQPVNSTAFPEDILDAFARQVQAEAEYRDLFGAGALRQINGKNQPDIAAGELLPSVRETLSPYRRFA